MATDYNPIPVAGTRVKTEDDADGRVAAAFDAYLYRPMRATADPMKLKIAPRIKLRQLAPALLPLALDADGKGFWTAPWTRAGWKQFVDSAKVQADMWNGRFWLLPPPSFSEFNIKFETFPTSEWQPNVICELAVDFAPTDEADKTIDVANLNLAMLAGTSHDTRTFRSHSLLYDSLDATPFVDPNPAPGEPPTQHTIAHEIGHAIGCGHIGAIRRLPLCQVAIAANAIGADAYAKLKGGPNAYYCYGH